MKLMSCSIRSVASPSPPRVISAVETCSAPCGSSTTTPTPSRARRPTPQSIADQTTVGIAQSECVEPLVGSGALEHRIDPLEGACLEQLSDLLLQRSRNEGRADIEVPHEPALHQRIDERNREIRHADHREQQRNQETQRKSKGPEHRLNRTRRLRGRRSSCGSAVLRT
jgi:hypothetical protein